MAVVRSALGWAAAPSRPPSRPPAAPGSSPPAFSPLPPPLPPPPPPPPPSSSSLRPGQHLPVLQSVSVFLSPIQPPCYHSQLSRLWAPLQGSQAHRPSMWPVVAELPLVLSLQAPGLSCCPSAPPGAPWAPEMVEVCCLRAGRGLSRRSWCFLPFLFFFLSFFLFLFFPLFLSGCFCFGEHSFKVHECVCVCTYLCTACTQARKSTVPQHVAP